MGYMPPPAPGEPDYVPVWYWLAMIVVTSAIAPAGAFFLATWFRP